MVEETKEVAQVLAVDQRPEGADSPETREDAVHQEAVDQETIIGTDVPVAPEAEGTKAAAEAQVKTLEQAPKPEDAQARPHLPKEAYNSEAYRAANNAARESFAQVVKYPGYIFKDHGGRYVDIYDLNAVYDAEPGTIIPEGLFLFPVNYLVREDERGVRADG